MLTTSVLRARIGDSVEECRVVAFDRWTACSVRRSLACWIRGRNSKASMLECVGSCLRASLFSVFPTRSSAREVTSRRERRSRCRRCSIRTTSCLCFAAGSGARPPMLRANGEALRPSIRRCHAPPDNKVATGLRASESLLASSERSERPVSHHQHRLDIANFVIVGLLVFGRHR